MITNKQKVAGAQGHQTKTPKECTGRTGKARRDAARIDAPCAIEYRRKAAKQGQAQQAQLTVARTDAPRAIHCRTNL